MPPRKPKPIDPDVLKNQWDEWQKTNEYELWSQLYNVRGEFPQNTSETSQHLTGPWQRYHDLLYQLCIELKVKPKKPFLHEFIRSAFYGQDSLKDQDQKIYFIVYAKKIIFSNQSSNACRAVRKAFIEIWRLLEDLLNLNESTFQKARKDMVALCKKFNSAYAEYGFSSLRLMDARRHIKSSHEEIAQILEFEMNPLEMLLISNIKWKTFYETCEYSEDLVFVSNFK
jgi:hypothetical protein